VHAQRAEARQLLDRFRDVLWDGPVGLRGLPYARRLPVVDLFSPEAVAGLISPEFDLRDIRDAARDQRTWLDAVADRLVVEGAARDAQLNRVTGLRQRLLVIPDRS